VNATPQAGTEPEAPAALPLLAPCRPLATTAPLGWIRKGWNDLKRAPRLSLGYGAAIAALSCAIAFGTYRFGDLGLYLGLLVGFMLLGPLLAVGLYSTSCQLEQGLNPIFGYCLRDERRSFVPLMLFGFVLLVIFLLWGRSASMVHIFFPMEADYRWQDLTLFLGVGSAIGAIFTTLVFTFSAFSLPMIMDRKVDAVTAVLTSVNAVLRNKPAMLVWMMLIATAMAISVLTLFLALVVLLPVLGHAAWHGYRETIDASAFPRHATGSTN
jgi:uncharacterized membrane protein